MSSTNCLRLGHHPVCVGAGASWADGWRTGLPSIPPPSISNHQAWEPAFHWGAAWTGGACWMWLRAIWSAKESWDPQRTSYTNHTAPPPTPRLPSSHRLPRSSRHSPVFVVLAVSLTHPNNCANLFHDFLIPDSLETATEKLFQELGRQWQQDRAQKAVTVLYGFLSLWHLSLFILIMSIYLCKQTNIENWVQTSQS